MSNFYIKLINWEPLWIISRLIHARGSCDTCMFNIYSSNVSCNWWISLYIITLFFCRLFLSFLSKHLQKWSSARTIMKTVFLQMLTMDWRSYPQKFSTGGNCVSLGSLSNSWVYCWLLRFRKGLFLARGSSI